MYVQKRSDFVLKLLAPSAQAACPCDFSLFSKIHNIIMYLHELHASDLHSRVLFQNWKEIFVGPSQRRL